MDDFFIVLSFLNIYMFTTAGKHIAILKSALQFYAAVYSPTMYVNLTYMPIFPKIII